MIVSQNLARIKFDCLFWKVVWNYISLNYVDGSITHYICIHVSKQTFKISPEIISRHVLQFLLYYVYNIIILNVKQITKLRNIRTILQMHRLTYDGIHYSAVTIRPLSSFLLIDTLVSFGQGR